MIHDFILLGLRRLSPLRFRLPSPIQVGQVRLSYCSCANIWRCFRQLTSAVRRWSIFSWIGQRPSVTLGGRSCSWMSVARRVRERIWNVRGWLHWLSSASSVALGTSPKRIISFSVITGTIRRMTCGVRPLLAIAASDGSSLTMRRRPRATRLAVQESLSQGWAPTLPFSQFRRSARLFALL